MISSPVFFAASGAHMSEALVSSCGSAADPYRRSMLRLLEYVGLQGYGTSHATMPPRTEAENAAIAPHLEAVKEAMARHEESVRRRNIRINKRKPTSALADIIDSAATAAVVTRGSDSEPQHASTSATDATASHQQPTIYLSFEDSAEWKAFLASIEPSDRLAVTVRRRLSIELWRAHHRDVCLWCWFPRNMCMCAQLDAFKAAMPAAVLDRHVEVTMLLHSEELMRSTNSGHVAAYLLGAPLRVWGMDADDFYLRELGPRCHRRAESFEVTESPVTVFNVSLYPSSEAVLIDEFIRVHHLVDGGAVAEAQQPQPQSQQEIATAVASPSCTDSKVLEKSDAKSAVKTTTHTATHDDSSAFQKIHLILLDSTWGQALSLNRNMSRLIPRVKLDIPTTYESLFQALRKRTRETGVSTLEATSMAVEQCIRAMGYTADAAQSSATLTAAMKSFVDARCLLKYAGAQFTNDGEALDAFRDRRDAARREDSARRQVLLAEKMASDADAQRLRLPPVLNYCYCCDCVIGWHRVAEHVMGRSHRTALLRNPTCRPSEASRSVRVPDFSRPTRSERATAAAATAAAASAVDAETASSPSASEGVQSEGEL